MNLQTIKDNIISAKSEEDLILFIRNNKILLENFFISLSDDDIEELKFDLESICTRDLIGLPFFYSSRLIPEIAELLTLFAQLFERIGFYGAISLIQNYLEKDSSIRLRLNAVCSFLRIGDLAEYVDKFDLILSKLQKAQYFEEIDYTGQVVQDLINYYLRGTSALEYGLLEKFKTLFNSQISKEKYKFLNHPSLKEYLDGYITEKIFVELIADKVYSPSLISQSIFKKLILDPIAEKGYLDKYKSDEIRADVLNYGRADFSQQYKDLSPFDRVQLYCYFNMRKHFFTSFAIYEKIYTSLKENIFQKDKDFTFIDFGCGSLTSGLAIASLYQVNEHKPIKINYIGIDIAESMLQKAKEFSQTELFNAQSMFYFYTNWELIEDDLLEKLTQNNSFFIFNASYLFASNSLDENSLANFMNKVINKLSTSAYFIFQNPDRADRNEKYQKFKGQIVHEMVVSETQQIYYKNNANSSFEPSNEVVNFEILSL